MPGTLFSPVELYFYGLDADSHYIDAEQFGRSLAGTAKIYNAATHLFYTGSVPSRRTIYKIKMYTSAEVRKGSVWAAIYSAMVMGEMAMYPQLWCELADLIVPNLVKAIYARLIHRKNEVAEAYDKMVRVLQEENEKGRQHAETIAQMGFSAILQNDDRFLQTIDNMASNSKRAAQSSVEPIGRSTARLEHLIQGRPIIQIDQPFADALRSKEELEVTDPATYYGKIVEADKVKKSCRVQLEGINKTVSAFINDPVIENTGNIYTRALDQDLRVEIQAKATMKNDEIRALYISHAKEADDF